MNNYIVSWNSGGVQNFLVSAESFSQAADQVWAKFFGGICQGIYKTDLNIDKNMGPFVYYVLMSDGSKFFVTSESWAQTKEWVYESFGQNVDTIMSLGYEYLI